LYYDEVLRLTQKNVRNLSVNAMNNLILEKVDFNTPGTDTKVQASN
ncbi:MAG: hypothetical protein H7Y04_14735, partial [Verrucomicrobia bacterium]|nr:hypothetical protein [Cytophagales bacterium]